ncbi:MAG: HAD hydrolase family protein [Lachnospiraceae bacterium]|jgi:YrbI family 3-deoxy-D-manno-octulosonate 8-phosphate phosphatase|nr:HAD hydrolase family protein [Lachnospiraceae bacterium]
MKMILIDVDGVLTDGRVALDVHGNETKMISYRDLDAIGVGRRHGYDFAFVTGEDTPMVNALATRFKVERVYAGAKDKLAAMKAIAAEFGVSLGDLLYIGDSDRDAPALEAVGMGIVPRDATANAKNAANFITESNGGYGVLLEVVDKLANGKMSFPGEDD